MIRTYYDPAVGITDGEAYMDEIMDCARLAISKYNRDKVIVFLITVHNIFNDNNLIMYILAYVFEIILTGYKL